MTLIAAGGHLDDKGEMTILKRVLSEARGQDSKVYIVSTATELPVETEADYRAAFKRLGIDEITVSYIDSRAEADDPATAAGVAGADVIFFSGGDQLRLSSLLGGTLFMDAVRERHAAGAVIGGTSAGAAAMSHLMIYGGDEKKAMRKGEIHMTAGLGFIDKVVFDTHFLQRDRLKRLFNVVATNPANIGVGLDEDTAVVIRDNNTMEVIGSGKVTIVDGSRLSNSTLTDKAVGFGKEFRAEGYIQHTLTSGDRFLIREKKLQAGI